jgi:hypothetical protein
VAADHSGQAVRQEAFHVGARAMQSNRIARRLLHEQNLLVPTNL